MKNLPRGKREVDLVNGPIFRSLMAFMLPIMLSNVLQNLYNAVDTAIVGNLLGDRSLAAIGACSSVFEMVIGLSGNLAGGFGLVVAKSYGKGSMKGLRQAVAGALTVGLISSLALTAVSLLLIEPLLKLIRTPEALLGEALSYIRVLCAGIAVTLTYNLFAVFLRSVGNSLVPLLSLAISSVINLFLDVAMIKIFRLGLMGTATATLVSQAVSMAFCGIYIWRKVPFLIPRKENFRVPKETLKQLAGQGWSMAISGSVVACGSVILQAGVNSLGETLIAANLAARKTFTVCCLPFGAMGLAMATFAGQNRGAGKPRRILMGLRLGVIYNLVLDLGVSVFLWTTGRIWVGLISGSSNAAILDNGSRLLHVAGPFLLAMGILDLAKFTLQALGSKIRPLISSIIELTGKILFTALLIPKFGYNAVIFCEPLIWVAMAAQLTASLLRHPYIREARKEKGSKRN